MWVWVRYMRSVKLLLRNSGARCRTLFAPAWRCPPVRGGHVGQPCCLLLGGGALAWPARPPVAELPWGRGQPAPLGGAGVWPRPSHLQSADLSSPCQSLQAPCTSVPKGAAGPWRGRAVPCPHQGLARSHSDACVQLSVLHAPAVRTGDRRETLGPSAWSDLFLRSTCSAS